MRKTALLLAAALCLYAADRAIDYAAEGQLWWSHIQYLASDALEGRNVGTEGFRKAVAYVSTQFERDGLQPAGTEGYQQPVHFDTRTLVPAESSLALVRDGQVEPLEMGADATLSTRADLAPFVDAPMVFVGYGMSIPEVHYDDFADIDLHGKIAVYIGSAGPVKAPDNLKSHYSSGGERWAALRKAGAIGIATIANPRTGLGGPNANAGRGGAGARGGRGAERPPQPSVVLADPSLSETKGEQIALTITRRGGPKFFEGSGHTYDEILELARAEKPLPHFALKGTLRAKAVMTRGTLEASNTAGVLPGSDPRLKNEYVIMSAHLDHLGVGRPINGDSIYNGAMDDASGIASVIEIARLMHASGAHLKRSVLFLAVTGEEKGELGSRYFAAHPTVPAGSIVADINLDMFLPLYPLKYLEVQGLAESTLGETVRAAARQYGVEVQSDREPEQNRFIRSDQYSFIREGIPALAFKFGYAFGSPEEQIRKTWVKDVYHKPNDDLNQPVDRAAAAKFDRIILTLLERVADTPARPQWHTDSFFRRFAEATR